MKPCMGGFNILASSDTDNPAFFRSDEQVNELHPQLVKVLKEVAASEVYIDRSSVLCALWLLHSDVFLRDIDGEPVAIYEASELTVTDGVLTITGRSVNYTEKTMCRDGATLRIPEMHSAQVTIDSEWLDSFHPEWQTRLQVAHDLGLEPLESLRALVQGRTLGGEVNTPDDLLL